MHILLTPTARVVLAKALPNGMSLPRLEGYLAAAASGPSFVMPDQILRWIWRDGLPDDQAAVNLIVHRYQSVNDALNDQTYIPDLTDPPDWCRGYLAGVAADMMAWAPLTAAQPELLKEIMAGECADLADATKCIHAFWLKRRRNESGAGGILEQLATMSPESSLPHQRPH